MVACQMLPRERLEGIKMILNSVEESLLLLILLLRSEERRHWVNQTQMIFIP